MIAALSDIFVDTLKDILGQKGWVDAKQSDQFVTDILGRGGDCLLVARPSSTQEVSKVVKVCAAESVAIIPQGGNTNVSRMAVPLDGQHAIILSLSRMSQIINVNPSANTTTVEAGVLMQTLQDAAHEQDRVFAPDWGARGTASVGGAVATNGGGLNVLRYGTTREQVLGLEVVLPDGTIWSGLRSLIKDNSGYDLKHLFIGSEGTLGIITKLVFKLHPRQPVTQSMMAVLSDMCRLSEFLDMARRIGGDSLIAFELLPGLGVEKALERYPDLQRPLETRADWYLLVRFAGQVSVEEALMQLFERGFEGEILSDAVLSSSVGQEQNLWEIREQMIPLQYFERKMLKWDVSVPTNHIVDFLLQAEALIKAIDQNAICYAVGHVGDGNIHYSAFPSDDADADAISTIYQTIDDLIWSMGGSIVAEHGVGAMFVDRVRKQKSATEYAMMQMIKNSFDPGYIMNPGKLLGANLAPNARPARPIIRGLSMFENIQTRDVENLLSLMKAFRADPRPEKVDLVVGVYKDEDGNVPIMRSVKAAEQRLVDAEDTKNYVGITGDAEFCEFVPEILLGKNAKPIAEKRIECMQTPGGSGALKVACDFLNTLESGKRIWVSTPTWANHIPVATDAGLTVDHYPYFRPSDKGLDFEGMIRHLQANAKPGDVLLIHACCHNPTGVDLSLEQWKTITQFVKDRRLMPLVDCAYQGLAEGLEADAAGLRHMANEVSEMIIANSFSKNFGIYRERTGAVSVIARTPSHLVDAKVGIETVIRSNYSMPPSHGARVVTTILSDPELRQDWEEELSEARARISKMRQMLQQKLQKRQVTFDTSFLTAQRGMFSYTGVSPKMVKRLKDEFGIYIAGDGRINIAGLCQLNLDVVAEGFASVIASEQN